jgi:hypothetical protein
VFRVHAIGLVRFALMLAGDQATAEDVVQDAFLGLYWAWDRVRDPDAVNLAGSGGPGAGQAALPGWPGWLCWRG